VTERREDSERRRHGAFFTPTIWAEEALNDLDKELGIGWEQDSIVWDPACGTGNLTAPRVFPDLLLSTLDPADLEVADERSRHPDTLSFAFDFVGGDALPPAAVARLQAASEAGKRIVFLANPPYATAGNLVLGAAKKTHVAKSPTNEAMRSAGIGKPSQQLYVQFMFQFAQLAETFEFRRRAVAIFSKPAFLTAGSFAEWRRFWFSRFRFASGFLFRADEFADVSSKWGVSFSLWTEGMTPLSQPLGLRLLRSDSSGTGLRSEGTKVLYNAVGRRANDWARGPRQPPGEDGIQLKGGLHVSEEGRGRSCAGHLGWINNDSNDVYHSARTVWLQSASKSSGQNNAGWFLTKENFVRSLVLFAARKAVTGTWINDKDEFLAPDPAVSATAGFEQWSRDAIVYAAVHSQNTCCAARALSYKGSGWDLHNHLFWRSSAEVEFAAAQVGASQIVEDARRAGGRRPELLDVLERQTGPASEAAQACWDLLEQLHSATLSLRSDYALTRPELHSLCWDAGLHQLKPLFEQAEPSSWRELKSAGAELRSRVCEGVYRFGLLVS